MKAQDWHERDNDNEGKVPDKIGCKYKETHADTCQYVRFFNCKQCKIWIDLKELILKPSHRTFTWSQIQMRIREGFHLF